MVPEGAQSLIGSQFSGMTLASLLLALLSARARWPRVGLSLIVLQAFVRGTQRWLACDRVSCSTSPPCCSCVDTVLVEVLLFVCSVALLWLGLRWSRRMTGAGEASTGHVV